MQPYIWAIEILGQSGHSFPVLFNEKGDLLDIGVSLSLIHISEPTRH